MWVWLVPTGFALFLYGIGQGLVKKYIVDVPPARFCLYFVVAKAVVNLGFYFTHTPEPLFSNPTFFAIGLLAYVMDGLGWILYFESIVAGPITIVGTLSAAYPVLTVLFARFFLGEDLVPLQYVGVACVILGCIGLAYDPSAGEKKKIQKRWIPFATVALLLWGASQTLVKFSYSLPHSSEVNLALLNTLGGALTLGLYGLWRGGRAGGREWGVSFLPMAMMAGGDLGVLVAFQNGPASIVTPLSGAYPVITLIFAWIVLKERLSFLQGFFVLLVLLGIFLAPGI